MWPTVGRPLADRGRPFPYGSGSQLPLAEASSPSGNQAPWPTGAQGPGRPVGQRTRALRTFAPEEWGHAIGGMLRLITMRLAVRKLKNID